MKLGKLRNTLLAGGALLLFSVAPLQAADTADILFVVDESGSMGGEHSWITGMVTALDSALIGAGVTGNRYGLVGYGGLNRSTDPINHGVSQLGHAHTVGSGLFGDAGELSTATSGLVAYGGDEDGYEAMNFGFSSYAFRNNAAVNVILITDEDRDTNGGLFTFADMEGLFGANALLNVVVDAQFSGGALGIDSTPDSYFADGFGGFTSSSGGSATTDFGTTIQDYVDLALATGGAAWDLEKLRAGGLTADSFTAAFVDIKVGEIIIQLPSEVPLPAAAFMFAPALLGFLGLRRRAKATVA